MITLTLNDKSIDVRSFREGNPLERFTAYLHDLTMDLYDSFPDLTTYRCSVSGWRIGLVTLDEFDDVIQHAARVLGVSEIGKDSPFVDDQSVIDALESIMDHVVTRMVALSRPGPSIVMENGSMALTQVGEAKQLAILLNQLLWDAGQYREKYIGLDDQMLRLMNTFKIADQIAANYEKNNAMGNLRDALIELDAKYRIAILRFTRKERDKFLALRGEERINFDAILGFVRSLIIYRDKYSDPETVPARWTQVTYREEAINAREREDKSNVLNPAKPSSIRVATGMSAPKKPGRPVSEKRQAVNEALSKALSGIKFNFKS